MIVVDKNILEKNEAQKRKEECIRLWNKFNSKNKPQEIREQLIRKYAYLVKWVAGRFPYVDNVDFDREDLLGYGTIGLIEAIDRYDPKQRCSFETFAINRVRGEILDFLRSRDFLTRSSRQRVKRFNETSAKLEINLGRHASDDELKEALGIDSEALRTIRKESAALIFSFDSDESKSPFEDFNNTLGDKIPSPNLSQEEFTEMNMLSEKLANAIDTLPKRERLIVALYHYQKLTFREISEILDISESRTSQLHVKALQRLKVTMKDYEI